VVLFTIILITGPVPVQILFRTPTHSLHPAFLPLLFPFVLLLLVVVVVATMTTLIQPTCSPPYTTTTTTTTSTTTTIIITATWVHSFYSLLHPLSTLDYHWWPVVVHAP